MNTVFPGLLLLGPAAGALLLSACAHVVNVAPGSNAIPPGEKIPLDVGLVLSGDLTRYQHSESRLGDTWNYPNLGQATAQHFRNYLEARFRSVQVLSSLPPLGSPTPYIVTIEPRIVGFTFDIPILKSQSYPATVRYRVRMYSGGQIIYEKEFSGVGDTPGSLGFDFAANPSKSAPALLRRACVSPSRI